MVVRESFDGVGVLVTGAGRGIGRSAAIQLAERGAEVVVAARSADELASTVAAIESAGGRGHAVQVDLAAPGGADLLAAAAVEASGRVDVLVNNAADVGPLGPTTSLDRDDVLDVLGLNLVSPMALSGALLPAMVRRGWGRIVNVSSGVVGRPATMIGGTAYTASKAALEAHTLNLAAELGGTGVTANVYRPGTVDTEMQAHIRDQDSERVGGGLVELFQQMRDDGLLVSTEESAAGLVHRLLDSDTGAVWTFEPGVRGATA